MKWIDSIRQIQRAANENRLVIFVGSGVSANAGIPTWGSLVKKFAEELNYDNCGLCTVDSDDCANEDCLKKYDFSRDEYLRIPEYYHNKHGAEKYNRFIQDALASEQIATPINDAIFRIMPHHIITTNYDQLLEASKEANAHLYSVISKDDDILSKNNPRYIIKMHGDIQSPDSIVLKESDYINYEQTHVLISTFIKSLLIDHTFLFVGYSLNDYNLNLIIGWINYFAKASNSATRPHNFIVQAESASEFEQVRLEKNNIYVAATNEMPSDVLERIAMPAGIADERGRMLFAYLNCIYAPETFYNLISLSDALCDNYEVLHGYNKVSHEDLLAVFPLNRTEVKAQTLRFHDRDLYNQIAKILAEDTEASSFIISTFQKACIDGLHFYGSEEAAIPIPRLHVDEDELLQLYLDNKYIELAAKLHNCCNPSIKAYYYCLLKTNISEVKGLMEDVERSIVSGDFISIIMYKINCRLSKITHFDKDLEGAKEIDRILGALPNKIKSATTYINKLFNSLDINHKKMAELLQIHEDNFSYNSNRVSTEHCFDKLWSIQAYAFDYYFFIKKNYLLMDHFNDMKNYLSYYLKAVFCTYSPIKESAEDTIFGLRRHLEHYPLGEIEIDMIVKYAEPKNIQKWIKKYKVTDLSISDEIDIASKFLSYCESFTFFGTNWCDQLHCFIILISKIQFDIDDLWRISSAFISLVEKLAQHSGAKVCNVISAISLFASDLMGPNHKDIMQRFLAVMITPEIMSAILERHSNDYQRILTILAPHASQKHRKQVYDEIEAIDDAQLKCQRIYYYRKLISKRRYKPFLKENMTAINSESLFHFVHEGYISYSNEVLSRFISIIESGVAERKTGLRSYPDGLTLSIESCILLKILESPVDISRLAPYSEYSDHLTFMLSPDDFDYSRVDTNNYMWCNLFKLEEYAAHFYTHRKEILTDDLEKLFINDFASMEQQKIAYGHLLERDQIWMYARDKLK